MTGTAMTEIGLSIAILLVGGWLSLKLLKFFISPYVDAGKRSKAPIQLFLTDYFVLLGEIGLGGTVILHRLPPSPTAQIPVVLIIMVVMTVAWHAATQVLSRARVNRFIPRAIGQFMFLIQTAAALFYGFAAIPMVISVFVQKQVVPILFGCLVVFVGLYNLFRRSSVWILRQADKSPDNA